MPGAGTEPTAMTSENEHAQTSACLVHCPRKARRVASKRMDRRKDDGERRGGSPSMEKRPPVGKNEGTRSSPKGDGIHEQLL